MKIGHIDSEITLLNLLDNLEFTKNQFDTYNYTKPELNREESVFYFFWELLAYVPLKDKKLSKRLKLNIESTGLDIVLDNIILGRLNYYQHSYHILEYPTHWFNVLKVKDINYILKLLVKYSLKNGLTLEDLNKALNRKIRY